MKKKQVVCLGGGIGTVNLIKGVKKITKYISVVVSMADEGGSSGRLRRLYRMFPPGDLVSCMAAICNDEMIAKLLTYRFPGNRYGRDDELSGHKLGNLIMAAAKNVTGDFQKTVSLVQKTFNISGNFFCATRGIVSISVRTKEGKIVVGEENIDLGRYNGRRVLDKVFLHPKTARAGDGVIAAMKSADVIIAGPGDLYTTVLPVLIVSDIVRVLRSVSAKRVFVVNIANKPFETKGYRVNDHVSAIKRHLGSFPFDVVVVNTNCDIPIPKKYHYTYVFNDTSDLRDIQTITGDFVDETFPLYHSPEKLAETFRKII